MKKSNVELITIEEPINAVGKTFFGDYGRSSEFVLKVQKILDDKAISIVPNKVLGVYYDDPREKNTDELRSFQGVFLSGDAKDFDQSLDTLSLSGRCLHIVVTGIPPKPIYQAYEALSEYIMKNEVPLRSAAGFQITTIQDDVITTEIFMEVED